DPARGGAEVALGVSAISRLVALLACLLAILATRTAIAPGRRALAPAASAGVGEAAGTSLALIASSLGNTALVAVLISLYAIVTVLLAQLLLRERLATHQSLGIAASAVGVALMSAG
ncbi:MAG: EamA family transporter, partial [Solirubrobacterales bacterium]